MRSQTNNGITLQYPDTIGFVFNPVLVIANDDSNNLTSMYIKMTCGDVINGVSYDAFSGKCYADVREYLQSIFDDVDFGGDVSYADRITQSKLGKTVTFDVTVYQGTDTTTEFSFSAFMVWGAMRMDGTDVYNDGRVARWFKNYPFTVGLYANESGKVEMVTNGTQQAFVDVSGQGVWNIKIDDKLIAGKDYIDIIDYSSIISAATFDNTFDITFGGTGSTDNRRMRIDIDDTADDGVYLRWVDRHGFFCYWLFKRGDEKRKISSEETYIRNNLVDFNRSYGFLSCLNDRHSMSRVDSIPLCAPSVDSDTFDMLQDITTSPVVDMFAGYASDGTPRWAPVTIDAGTYTKGRTVLQDFALSMTLQETPVQSF